MIVRHSQITAPAERIIVSRGLAVPDHHGTLDLYATQCRGVEDMAVDRIATSFFADVRRGRFELQHQRNRRRTVDRRSSPTPSLVVTRVAGGCVEQGADS